MTAAHNILFCYSRVPSFTNAVRDYVNAFKDHSRHHIHYLDMDSAQIPDDLSPYDAIIFNYCFWARCLSFPQDAAARVKAFAGRKLAIFQDEYDYFLQHQASVMALGVDTIITGVPEAHWQDVYRDPYFRNVRFMNALTGYVPDALIGLPSGNALAEREWTIGYRARPVPFIYGRLTYEKYAIGEKMQKLCQERGINANIAMSEEERIYGAGWQDFIRSCRAMLGTESGSNLFDFDGTIKPAIAAYLQEHPQAGFEEVHEKFLAAHDDKIHMNQVSPRLFEAIALRTALILYEGEYSGVVQPWVHYIPLKKDMSNIDEVLAALEDIPALEAMVARAYDDVIASGRYSFRSYIARIDDLFDTAPKGFESCYGLIGWRSNGDAALQPVAASLRAPTSRPLIYKDAVPDPVLTLRFDYAALQRRILQHYAAVLYSPCGQKWKQRLQRNKTLYDALQRTVRFLTGRK